jgi:hypothetical protein
MPYTEYAGIALKMSQNYFAKISKLHYLIIIFAYYNANLAYFRQTYISQYIWHIWLTYFNINCENFVHNTNYFVLYDS